jgi:DUF1680 family protein
VRFIPSVPGYVYATKGETLYVNLFISGSGTVNLPNNKTVLKQQTRYPWEGDIRITVEPEKPKEFAICVRVPDWARNQPVPSDLYRFMNESNQKVTLRVNGEQVVLDIDKGFASIKRTWKQGDTIELNLPMPIRRVLCNEKVKENNGRAALQRGPIVYCAEAVDNGGQVAHIVLNNDAELHTEYRQGLLGGASIITGKVLGVAAVRWRSGCLQSNHVVDNRRPRSSSESISGPLRENRPLRGNKTSVVLYK